MPFLGLDVGTGGSRAVLVSDEGRVLASATDEHVPFASPKTGWAEQDPRDWWRASAAAIRAVVGQLPSGADAIQAIGLSGQMHGAVLVDAAADVLRPSIIWCDQRSADECREITERIGPARLIELTANPALTGFTLPKLLWVRRHEPDVWARVRGVLLPKDYVRLHLTGDRASDVADASGTLLFDVAHRCWSRPMLDEMRIDMSWLPRVFEGPATTGVVSPSAASATGLRPGTPVVAGGGDQAAGAVGMGAVRPGVVSVTIGTSGVVFAATDVPALDRSGRVHTFCHAVPGRWHVMGVTQAAGLSLRWLRDTFPAGFGAANPYDVLTREAAAVPPGSDGVLWAPYLMGERTPHLDPDARAALVGLAASHTRGHVTRAILEGVAFSLRDSFEILRAMEVPIERVVLGGGGARSALWRQIHADVLGVPVSILRTEEGAAFGAALLAAVGAGRWSSVDAACEAAVAVASEVRPDVHSVDVMDQHYRRFQTLYPALQRVSGLSRARGETAR